MFVVAVLKHRLDGNIAYRLPTQDTEFDPDIVVCRCREGNASTVIIGEVGCDPSCCAVFCRSHTRCSTLCIPVKRYPYKPLGSTPRGPTAQGVRSCPKDICTIHVVGVIIYRKRKPRIVCCRAVSIHCVIGIHRKRNAISCERKRSPFQLHIRKWSKVCYPNRFLNLGRSQAYAVGVLLDCRLSSFHSGDKRTCCRVDIWMSNLSNLKHRIEGYTTRWTGIPAINDDENVDIFVPGWYRDSAAVVIVNCTA